MLNVVGGLAERSQTNRQATKFRREDEIEEEYEDEWGAPRAQAERERSVGRFRSNRQHFSFWRYPIVRPILEPRDQPCTYRILENVIGLFSFRFLLPQTMVEEITLPCETAFRCRPTLPVGDRTLQGTLFRDSNDRMNMVGHDEDESNIPDAFCVPVLSGIEKQFWYTFPDQWSVFASGGTDRDEKELASRADAQWRIMREFFSASRAHVSVPIDLHGENPRPSSGGGSRMC